MQKGHRLESNVSISNTYSCFKTVPTIHIITSEKVFKWDCNGYTYGQFSINVRLLVRFCHDTLTWWYCAQYDVLEVNAVTVVSLLITIFCIVSDAGLCQNQVVRVQRNRNLATIVHDRFWWRRKDERSRAGWSIMCVENRHGQSFWSEPISSWYASHYVCLPKLELLFESHIGQ